MASAEAESDQRLSNGEVVAPMNWTDTDEQLYQALALEQALSSKSREVAQRIYGSTYPCNVQEINTIKGDGIQYYWKMPRRWWADPLNGWNIAHLILWIPVNVVYFSFQGIRSLASTRNSWTPPQQIKISVEPYQLRISGYYGPDRLIDYRTITSVGYYANGLRMDYSGAKLLLAGSAMPSLLVTLRHFAPNASLTAGLPVAGNFVDRCAASGRQIDISRLAKNPPTTWVSEPKTYKVRPPLQAIIGIALAVVFALLIIRLAI
jgi:hypothetical protein